MLIERISVVSKKMHSMEIDVTSEQLKDFHQGKLGLIQDAFPHLNFEEREFILTGITPQEWDELFKYDEDLD